MILLPLYVVTPHQGTALAGQACHHPPCSHCRHPCADRVNTTLSHSEAARKAADRWLGAPEHIHDCVRLRSSTNFQMLQEETMHVSLPIGRRPPCDESASAAVRRRAAVIQPQAGDARGMARSPGYRTQWKEQASLHDSSDQNLRRCAFVAQHFCQSCQGWQQCVQRSRQRCTCQEIRFRRGLVDFVQINFGCHA